MEVYLSFFDHTASRKVLGNTSLYYSGKEKGTMSYLLSYCSHFARYIAKMSCCTSKIGYFTVFFSLFLTPWELFDLSYSSYTCSHTGHPWYLASLLLICHELDFRLWKSSNWIFQDKWWIYNSSTEWPRLEGAAGNNLPACWGCAPPHCSGY